MVETILRESPSGPPVVISGGETDITLVSVRYVDPATPLDPDEQTGSDEAPFETLQQAIDSIADAELDNATIFLVDGDYGSQGATYSPFPDDILQIVGFGSAQNIGLIQLSRAGASHITFQNLSLAPSDFSFTADNTDGTYEFIDLSMTGNIDAPANSVVLKNSTIDGNITTGSVDALDSTVTGDLVFESTVISSNSVFNNISSTGEEASIQLRNRSNVLGSVSLPNTLDGFQLESSFVRNGASLPTGNISAINSLIVEPVTVDGIDARECVFSSVTANIISLRNVQASTIVCNGPSNILVDGATIDTLTGANNHLISVGSSLGTVSVASTAAFSSRFENIAADFSNATVSQLEGCDITDGLLANAQIIGGSIASCSGTNIELLGCELDAAGVLQASNLGFTSCMIQGQVNAAASLLFFNCRTGASTVIGGTATNTWVVANTYLHPATTFLDATIDTLFIDTASFYAGVNDGLLGSGGSAPTPTALTFLDPPLSATISITVPAVADGAVGYATTSLVGSALEGVFTAANQPVVVNPQADLVAAGAGGGFINARIAAADSLRTTFIGPLAGGAANFTVCRGR